MNPLTDSPTAAAIARTMSANARKAMLRGFPVGPSPMQMELLHLGVVNEHGELRPFGTKVLFALREIAPLNGKPVVRTPRTDGGEPKPRLEKHEQTAIVQLLESLGAAVYVIGTRRPKGDYQGTAQTPGVADLIAFIPKRGLLMIEVKSARGRLRDAQRVFQQNCRDAKVAHVVGGLDAVIQWLVDAEVLRADQVAPHHVLDHAS